MLAVDNEIVVLKAAEWLAQEVMDVEWSRKLSLR